MTSSLSATRSNQLSYEPSYPQPSGGPPGPGGLSPLSRQFFRKKNRQRGRWRCHVQLNVAQAASGVNRIVRRLQSAPKPDVLPASP